MKREVVAQMLAGALLLSGCLPGDTRPTPGHVFVTVEASVATTGGFSTEDGWTIQFERLLAGIGNVSLEGEACNVYANAGYNRLFDFTVLSDAEKLGEVYGLGPCDLRVRLGSPSQDAVLGKGVSESDREFMRMLPDVTVEPLPTLPVENQSFRTAVYARGVAKRGAETKRFDWKLTGRFNLSDCASSPDATPVTSFHLAGGDDKRPAVTVHGEELFRAMPEDGSPLRFDALVGADANSDGAITLEELASVPAPAIDMDAGVEDAGVEDAGAVDGGIPGLGGLALFLNQQMVPRMVRLDQTTCKVVNNRRGGL